MLVTVRSEAEIKAELQLLEEMGSDIKKGGCPAYASSLVVSQPLANKNGCCAKVLIHGIGSEPLCLAVASEFHPTLIRTSLSSGLSLSRFPLKMLGLYTVQRLSGGCCSPDSCTVFSCGGSSPTGISGGSFPIKVSIPL
jgi:hypothetical protein